MRLRVIIAVLLAATAVTRAQTPTAVTPDSLVTAAKRAAGQDYAGTFLRICVAPDNLGAGRAGGAAAAQQTPLPPTSVPDRATWYAQPYKVFDNLYFIGTKIHSAWALTTSDGIIVIDTLFDYAIEPEIVEGTDDARPRSARHQVRLDQPCARRSRSGRGAAAEPLRRQDRDGRGRLGLDAAAPRHRSRRRAETRHRRGAGRLEDHARRHHRRRHRHARPHAGTLVVHLSRSRTADAR